MPNGRLLYTAPTRAYSRSLVPLASRGYTPNTVELKVKDTPTATYNVNTTTASIVALCVPTLGSDMTQRIGRKIIIKKIQVQGFIRSGGAEALTTGNLPASYNRFILLWDTQPNGALPALSDILAENHPASPLNLNNRDRFVVLRDKRFVIDPFLFNTTTLGAASNQIKPVKLFVSCQKEVIFNAENGGTIADIASGALLAVWTGNQASSTPQPAQFVGSYRVRYSDA